MAADGHPVAAAQRRRLLNGQGHSGSQTAIQTGNSTEGSQNGHEPVLQPVLRLRGASIAQPSTRRQPVIRWADDVIDNEGLGRKSSKVCCIYHAPRPIDESSDESSSDSSSSSSDSDSDSDSELDRARPTTRNRRAMHDNQSGHDHDCSGGDGHDHSHNHGQSYDTKGKRKGKDGQKKGTQSKNAYERIPKPRMKGKGGSVTITEQ